MKRDETNAGAPEKEIVTTEMAEAGASALAGFSRELEFLEERAIKVFRAMMKAKKTGAVSGH